MIDNNLNNLQNITSDKHLENVAEKKNFFSKKNIAIITICILLSIALLVVTILYILNIDFIQLFANIGKSFSNPLAAWWFIGLIVFFFYSFLSPIFVLWFRCHELKIKISAKEWLWFAGTVCFLKAVTPANLIYDPYTIFWLRTKGVNSTRATSLMFFNTWIWQLLQIFVTLPSFIIVCLNVDGFFASKEGKTVFVFACLGYSFDFICFIFMTLLCCSKKVHYLISVIFNWIKKKLKMSYHTKEESKQKYEKKEVMKKHFYEYLCNWKITLACSLLIIFGEMFTYVSMFLSMKFSCGGLDLYIDFWQIFNAANIVFTANKMIPLPGGTVTLEWMMFIFVKTMNVKKEAILPLPSEEQIKGSIAIWRCFYTYFPAFIGIFGFGAVSINQLKKAKNNKLMQVDK